MGIEEGQDGNDKDPESDFNPLDGLQFFQFSHIFLLHPFLRGMDQKVCESNLDIWMTLLAGFESLLSLLERQTGMGSMTVGAVGRSLVFQMNGCFPMVVFEIGSFLDGVANTAHFCHPFSKLEAGPAGVHVMADMTASAGRGIFPLFHQCFGVRPFQITLVFLGMTSFTSLIIVKERGCPAKEPWVRVLDTFFFYIFVALRTGETAMRGGKKFSHVDGPGTFWKI
jgi:hypothetical protein